MTTNKSKKIRPINLRYLPKTLSKRDKKKQTKMLQKSQKLYKHGKYYTRKPLKSFKSTTSKHILNARKMYGVNVVGATNELTKKTGCSKTALSAIIRKGEGAYFSSGSRPNQTAQSWGIARLASALTAGKAGAIDYEILAKGCKEGSKGLKMAKLSRKKYGYGHRKIPKVVIS